MERQRTPGLSPRRDDPHEYRVGRLKHERVQVPREGDLLAWAHQVMLVHAQRKSILEVNNLNLLNKLCLNLSSSEEIVIRTQILILDLCFYIYTTHLGFNYRQNYFVLETVTD